jgi:hypothetical protein
MASFEIYKLLRCVSLIENSTVLTCVSASFTNVTCNFCGLLLNPVKLDGSCSVACHNFSLVLFRNIKEHVCDKRFRRMATVPSYLDLVPASFIHDLLKSFPRETLFQFALAFPQFLEEILNPVYWNSIRFITFINTDKIYCHFTIDDVLNLMGYLSVNLNELLISNIKNTRHYLNSSMQNSIVMNSNECCSIIDLCPNIQSLDLPIVFTSADQETMLKLLNKKLKKLSSLKMEITRKFQLESLNNTWIKLLGDFQNLHSISIIADFMSNHAIINLIKAIRLLTSFEVDTFGMVKGDGVNDEYVIFCFLLFLLRFKF